MARHIIHLKLGSKPAQNYVRLSITLLSQQVNHIKSGVIRRYVVAFVCLHFCLIGYQSAQFIRRALHYASGSHIFYCQRAQQSMRECIHCHAQTDCFVVSQLFSMARHVGRLKLELKPAQPYNRLSNTPLSQQVNHTTLKKLSSDPKSVILNKTN